MAGTFTLTFGDQAENHVGMQKIGEQAEEGFSITDLQKAKTKFEKAGYTCELHKLHKIVKEPVSDAAVLIVRDGVNALLANKKACDMYDEQVALEYDKKAFMYGRVVNKHARHNICFADFSQEPDYENKKGRIVEYSDVPLLQECINTFPTFLGNKATDLTVEGNFYYDVSKCGIGFHGDSERRKVIAIRLGETIPLHYQWFKDGKPVGKRIELSIEHADLYVMSEKAVGWDWKSKSKYTLRHAAGAEKYLTVKK